MEEKHPKVISIRKVLIDRGIEQAWRRRLLNNIHAGVRVKIRNDPMQKMLRHIWPRMNLFKNKMNHIASQTVPIVRIDRQTSYDFVRRHSSSASSTTTITTASETSKSHEIHDENSTTSEITTPTENTSSNSTTSVNHQQNQTIHRIYQRYPNRNNNATESDEIKRISDMISIQPNFITEKQRKRRFLIPFLHFLSSIRLKTWKSNDHQQDKTSMSRCRRSLERYRLRPSVPVKINDDLLIKSSSSVAQVLNKTNNSSFSVEPRSHSRSRHRRQKERKLTKSRSMSAISVTHSNRNDANVVPCDNHQSMSQETTETINEQSPNSSDQPIRLHVKKKFILSDLSRFNPRDHHHHQQQQDYLFKHQQMNVVKELQRVIQQQHENNNNHAIKSERSDKNLPVTREHPLPSLNSTHRHSHFHKKTHPILQDGIKQLQRFQQYAENYQLKSNRAVKEFLLESTVLSTDALHQLSTNLQEN